MALIKTEVTQAVVDYLARHAPQDPVLERVARETAEMPRAEMATTPDEAALLTMLARLIGSRHALEVGTLHGLRGDLDCASARRGWPGHPPRGRRGERSAPLTPPNLPEGPLTPTPRLTIHRPS